MNAHRHEERPVGTLLAPDILALLEESPGDVAAETEELHPANLADIAEALPRDRVAALLAALAPARAADVLEYMDEELRTEVLETLSAREAAALISEMTPDDRADALEVLEDHRAEAILSEIPGTARRETEQLLAYEPDSAGGLMTTEFVSVPEDLKVEDALEAVRAVARLGRREAMYSVYATDAAGKLQGVFSLRELLAAPAGARVRDISWADIMSVPPTADREEVAQLTRKYDLVAVPVVESSGKLIGVVTVDDVLDAIEEEQTEDVQMLGGVAPLDEPYFQAGFWNLARKRAGWLVLLFLAEMLTGTAMHHYEATLAATSALILFIPLIISSGGNSGSQSATLITRALAVGDVEMRQAMRVMLREGGQGLVLGAFLGAIGYARAVMWGNPPAVGVVIGVTLMAVVLTGTLVGATLPLVFTKLGLDPAIASSPFVSSFVDIAGIVIYLSVATAVLGA
jgi:magnesium transporter